MSWSYRTLLFLVVALSVVSCLPQSQEVETESTVGETFDPGVDYFPDKVQVRYAEHFSVSYHGNYKVVRTHAEVKTWQSDDPPEPTEDVLVLVQTGTPAPELVGDLASASVLTVPATTVAVNNDGTLAFLQALERTEDVLAVGGSFIYEDDLRARAESGEIGQIGYSWHGEPDLEVMLAASPDLALMTVDSPGNVKSLGRARELGIAAAPTFEWAEKHYLGRAEWLKYAALFFNAEAEAEALFEEVAGRVAVLKAHAAARPEKPAVLWGYYSGNGRWFMHRHNLEARLLADAHAVNPFADFDGDHRSEGEPISSERLLMLSAEADHWIIGDIHAAELPPEAYMEQFKAWREGKLYHNYKRTKWEYNAYDYYKTALVRPDWILADLIKLLHPESTLNHETVFLDHYAKP